METFTSDLSGSVYDESEKVCADSIRKSLLDLIREDHPEFTGKNYLSESELIIYRDKFLMKTLTEELAKRQGIDTESARKLLRPGEIQNNMLADEENPHLTFGQRLADKVADFGGSWKFLIIFISTIVVWIIVNVFLLTSRAFDPYPFIFLNLVLSCVAALQAPVIMMSQNRQEEKDRERARQDYIVNLKSELEIRMLHDKIDGLIIKQQKEILEMQKTQLELLHKLNAKDGI